MQKYWLQYLQLNLWHPLMLLQIPTKKCQACVVNGGKVGFMLSFWAWGMQSTQARETQWRKAHGCHGNMSLVHRDLMLLQTEDAGNTRRKMKPEDERLTTGFDTSSLDPRWSESQCHCRKYFKISHLYWGFVTSRGRGTRGGKDDGCVGGGSYDPIIFLISPRVRLTLFHLRRCHSSIFVLQPSEAQRF